MIKVANRLGAERVWQRALSRQAKLLIADAARGKHNGPLHTRECFRAPAGANFLRRMVIKAFLQGVWLTVAATSMLIGLFAEVAGADASRNAAKQHRTRRVLYNFDGCECMYTQAGGKGPVPVTVEDLERHIEEVPYDGSRVDTVLVCINAQGVYYPTKVGTMVGTPPSVANHPFAAERLRRSRLGKERLGRFRYRLGMAVRTGRSSDRRVEAGHHDGSCLRRHRSRLGDQTRRREDPDGRRLSPAGAKAARCWS